MADKKSVIDIKIETANSAKSIGEMNKALKDLKGSLDNVASGSAEWKKLSKAINETEGRIGDINDSFNTLRGSGIERVNSSLGLFKEGLGSLDFGKIGIALKGLGSAFKAVLPFALIEGLKMLYENWDKVVEFAAKIIPALGNVSAETKRLQKQTDELAESNKNLNSIYETHIILLEAMGNKEKEISDFKKEILANDTKQLELQLQLNRAKEEDAARTSTMYEEALKLFHFDQMANENRQERLKEFSDKSSEIEGQLSKKRAEASALRIKDIDAEIKKTKEHSDAVIKRMIDEAKTNNEKHEEWKKLQKEKEEKQIAWGKSVTDGLQSEYDKRRAIIEWEREEKAKEDKLNAEIKEKERQQWEKESADRREFNRKNNDDDRELRLAEMNEGFKQAEVMANALGNLSTTVFQIKMANVKKGSAEEEKAARKNFKIQKGVQLALAGIDGAKAITASLAAAPLFVGVSPNPAGIAGLAAAITTTGAAIATIAARQFDASAWTAPPVDTSGSSGGGIGGSNTSAPNTQAPTTGSQPFTRLDESGRNQSLPTVKAYVVESEMTDKQKRVGRLESQASF